MTHNEDVVLGKLVGTEKRVAFEQRTLRPPGTSPMGTSSSCHAAGLVVHPEGRIMGGAGLAPLREGSFLEGFMDAIGANDANLEGV